jgi:leader peptidase (prepilin peptidase)/N-methyltransferase
MTMSSPSDGRRRGSPLALGLAALAVPASAAAAGLPGWHLAAACAFGWVLLALIASDLERLILPDELTLPLIPAGLAEAWVWDGLPAVQDRAVGAVAGFLSFAGLRWLYRRWRGREGLGGGDVKLLAAAGAWIGWQGLPALVLAAALMGLALVLLAGRPGGVIRADRPVPFGAYLALALWAIWLYGPPAMG